MGRSKGLAEGRETGKPVEAVAFRTENRGYIGIMEKKMKTTIV